MTIVKDNRLYTAEERYMHSNPKIEKHIDPTHSHSHSSKNLGILTLLFLFFMGIYKAFSYIIRIASSHK